MDEAVALHARAFRGGRLDEPACRLADARRGECGGRARGLVSSARVDTFPILHRRNGAALADPASSLGDLPRMIGAELLELLSWMPAIAAGYVASRAIDRPTGLFRCT